MIGQCSSTPLRTLFDRIGADTTARSVGFECAGGYCERMDMASARHSQTIMAFKPSDKILPRAYGYPFESRKNPEFVTTIFVTNPRPHGLRTDRGYIWFSGI
jgi:DMSO/TMAO reductase YedYZ molybdopterin-dependent catalytic subunit